MRKIPRRRKPGLPPSLRAKQQTSGARFAGKDCCCSIVASLAGVFTDPHYAARGVFHHLLANPEGATMPGLPVPLDPGFRAAPEAAIASPALGSDNKTYLG